MRLHFLTQKEAREIRIRYSEVHLCRCGRRYIEITYEVNRGYTRKDCPFCKPYLREIDIIPS